MSTRRGWVEGCRPRSRAKPRPPKRTTDSEFSKFSSRRATVPPRPGPYPSLSQGRCSGSGTWPAITEKHAGPGPVAVSGRSTAIITSRPALEKLLGLKHSRAGKPAPMNMLLPRAAADHVGPFELSPKRWKEELRRSERLRAFGSRLDSNATAGLAKGQTKHRHSITSSFRTWQHSSAPQVVEAPNIEREIPYQVHPKYLHQLTLY